jgi:hypothetical protein
MFLLESKRKAEREEEERKRIELRKQKRAQAEARTSQPQRPTEKVPVRRLERHISQGAFEQRKKGAGVDYLSEAMMRSHVGGKDIVVPPVDDDDDDEWEDVALSCGYVGTFELATTTVDKAEVKAGIRAMQQFMGDQRPAEMVLSLEGLKVVDTLKQTVAMAHALVRISMSTTDKEYPLLGFVAKNPGKPTRFCHVFAMRKMQQAVQMQALMGKAFKILYAQRHCKKPGKEPDIAPPKASKHTSSQEYLAPPPAEQQRHKDWARHNPIPEEIVEDRRLSGRHNTFDNVSALPRRAPRAAVGAATAAKARPPPTKKHHDLDITNAVWFQASIPRDIAMELIEYSDDGAFIVRNSLSQPGNYALTLKGKGLIHHFLIQSEPKGLRLGQPEHRQPYFANLSDLIMHYTRPDQGILPCPIDLDCFNTDFTDKPTGQESYVDPDYQSLKEIRAHLGRV